MPPSKTPQEFVAIWKKATLKERSAAQPHFIGLCQIIGHPTPEEDDPAGERYAFEAGTDKQRGGQGWADVWKRGFFAWEYKGMLIVEPVLMALPRRRWAAVQARACGPGDPPRRGRRRPGHPAPRRAAQQLAQPGRGGRGRAEEAHANQFP